jgi:predicted alpha/beta-fold hydrolase
MAKDSKYFYLETPEKGGHVGFAFSSINGQYYSEHVAYNFTKKYL